MLLVSPATTARPPPLLPSLSKSGAVRARGLFPDAEAPANAPKPLRLDGECLDTTVDRVMDGWMGDIFHSFIHSRGRIGWDKGDEITMEIRKTNSKEEKQVQLV